MQIWSKCTSFECQCAQHESTNWGHYFYVSYWRHDCHFTWSSEPLEDLAVSRAKEVPSFVSYLRPWVLVWPRELNVWPSPLRSSALPSELIPPPAHFSIVKNHTNLGLCSLLPWLSCLLLWNLLTGQWNNLLQLSQYIHGGVLSLVWLFLSWGKIFNTNTVCHLFGFKGISVPQMLFWEALFNIYCFLFFSICRRNQITSFPTELCSLPLQVLNLSNNKLSTLPVEIGLLTLLQDLVSYTPFLQTWKKNFT